MKAESPDKGTIAQVYLLRPVLPHLRTRIPKVENIKMPVAYGIETVSYTHLTLPTSDLV